MTRVCTMSEKKIASLTTLICVTIYHGTRRRCIGSLHAAAPYQRLVDTTIAVPP